MAWSDVEYDVAQGYWLERGLNPAFPDYVNVDDLNPRQYTASDFKRVSLERGSAPQDGK